MFGCIKLIVFMCSIKVLRFYTTCPKLKLLVNEKNEDLFKRKRLKICSSSRFRAIIKEIIKEQKILDFPWMLSMITFELCLVSGIIEIP